MGRHVRSGFRPPTRPPVSYATQRTSRWSIRSTNPAALFLKNSEGVLVDTIGESTVLRSSIPVNAHPTMQQVKGSGFAGAGSATVTGLLTTDTITATGDAPTCSVNGTLTFSGADCWDVYVHRAGAIWAYWPGINVGQTTELDASGNGHHLTALTTTTITERLDGAGTDYCNDNGFSEADGIHDFIDATRSSILPDASIFPTTEGYYVPDGQPLVSVNIADWAKTNAIVSNANGLTLPTASGISNHTNVALKSTTIGNKSSWSLVGTVDSPARCRPAFGTDILNFCFLDLAAGKLWRVVNGVFTSAGDQDLLATSTAIAVNAGDTIRITVHGNNSTPIVQVFKNDVISATFIVPAAKSPALPAGDIYHGVSFRSAEDAYSRWAATEFNSDTELIAPYVHLSIDDVLGMLIDSLAHDSLFDEPRMAFLKGLHDTYGVKVSLYLYCVSGSYDIADMTDKHKSGFIASSSWLRLGFHAYDSTSNYATETAENSLAHYGQIISAITNFAGSGSIDTFPRTHTFAGNIDNVRAWKSLGLTGLLSADDTRASYYHTEAQRSSLVSCDSLIDYAEGIHFLRTDIRFENETDVATTLGTRKTNVAYAGQQVEHIWFTHESYLSDSPTQAKIISAIEWAVSEGLSFDFPMNKHGNIRKCLELTKDKNSFSTYSIGPLRRDLIVIAGDTYPDLTVTAPLGPKFQAIAEWTNNAAVDLSTLVATANTRLGTRGVGIWNPGLDATGVVRADRVLKP